MKTLVKRMLRPYNLELGCVEAYESNAPTPETSQSDTTDVYQTLEPVTVSRPRSAGGDSVRVDSVTVRRGFEVNGDTTWTDTTRVAGGLSRETVKDNAPFGTKTIAGRFWDWVMDLIDDT